MYLPKLTKIRFGGQKRRKKLNSKKSRRYFILVIKKISLYSWSVHKIIFKSCFFKYYVKISLWQGVHVKTFLLLIRINYKWRNAFFYWFNYFYVSYNMLLK